jgi:hypothetical protein
MAQVLKALFVSLIFNLFLYLSSNLAVTSFPISLNQNVNIYVLISTVVFIFYLVLEKLLSSKFKIDSYIKEIFLILIVYPTPLVLFQIQNINRLYFYSGILLSYLLIQFLKDKSQSIYAGVLILILFSNFLIIQSTNSNTVKSNISTEQLPSLLTFNSNIDQYIELDYISTNIDSVSYSLNPTGRNPYSAVFKIENVLNPVLDDNIFGQFENENLKFKYDYLQIENTYYVEGYFLGLDEKLLISIFDNEKNEKLSYTLNPISIEIEHKFNIEKNYETSSWLWISGAGDSNILFLDSKSNPRAYISLNTGHTSGHAKATAQLYDEKIVFFNDKDYKYYSVNYFGNFNMYFDNDLNKQYEYHHDISPSKESNLDLVLVKDLNQKPITEDVIIEINTSTNTIVRTIDLKNLLDLNLPVIDDAFFEVDGGVENEEYFDWFHANSIEYDERRNEIVISGRHQGLIGLDYETLELNWFIPHNPEFYEENLYEYPILKASFKNYMSPNGQHNLTIQGNNIFYFDNQAIPKTFNGDSNYNPYDLKSYLVKLEVDFEKSEIISQELKSYENVWSKIRGGIDYQDSNLSNYLISFGGIYYDEFGARTLSRRTNPKTFEWKVVEFNEESVARVISAKGRGAYRALFFNP